MKTPKTTKTHKEKNARRGDGLERRKKRDVNRGPLTGPVGGGRVGGNGLATDRVTRDTRAAELNMANEAAPLIMMPLKLEYRFIRSSLYFRWYFDESFSEPELHTPTDDEIIARDNYLIRIGTSDWWDIDNPNTSAAWQTFATSVGVVRAIHLMRLHFGTATNPDPTRLGRIAALPERVHLFAYDRQSGALTEIARGNDIPQNTAEEVSAVSYSPDIIDDGSWLKSFRQAIDLGMAVEIDQTTSAQGSKSQIEMAQEADWIIAVGVHKGQAKGEIEALLSSAIHDHKFSILHQNTPTNNAPGATSYRRDPETHILDYTKAATAAERGDVANSGVHGSALLAKAFGVDPQLFSSSIGAHESGFKDAMAMLYSIGPGLLGSALENSTAILEVTRQSRWEFIELLAKGFFARGALPALRVGNNAFGVLPVTDVATFTFDEDAGKRRSRLLSKLPNRQDQYYDLLNGVAKSMRNIMPSRVDGVVPVVKPGAASAPDTLTKILQTNSVSQRAEIFDSDDVEEGLQPVGCPYVEGTTEPSKAVNYLNSLSSLSLADDGPKPGHIGNEWPLLFRLIQYSQKTMNWPMNIRSLEPRELRDRIRDGMLNDVEMQVAGQAVQIREALSHLKTIAERPNGVAQLEILMFEVFDFFQYRSDAVMSGLAYTKLSTMRNNGQASTSTGYFGFLGKLRKESTTGQTDGYIQAPSTPQAVTAAILRSAYLRHGADSAFELDLSSRRVRRSLKLMDLISKGHSMSEALGLRGERWLHDNKENQLILHLRFRHPITGEVGEPLGARSVFDGLAVLNTNMAVYSPDERSALKKLIALIKEDIDAMSDIVLAEAAHQRTLGNSHAANAWLQVLSGHPPPGIPTFLKTQRHGQGVMYRALFATKNMSPRAQDMPREIAEPSLARFAVQALSGFTGAYLTVTAKMADEALPVTPLIIRLSQDLGLSPIDLVIGGKSELIVRAKSFALSRAMEDPALLTALGALAQFESFATGRAEFEIDFNVGSNSVNDLLDIAVKVRAIFAKSRFIEPTDINNFAQSISGELTEAEHVDQIQFSISALRERVDILKANLGMHLTDLLGAYGGFKPKLEEYARLLNIQADPATIEAQKILVDTSRRALEDKLRQTSFYSEPAGLKPIVLQAVQTEIDSFDDAFNDIKKRLEHKYKTLAGASTASHASLTAVEDAVRIRRELIEALQTCLDGEALPILPPLQRRVAKMKLALETETPSQMLPLWSGHRERMTQSEALVSGMAGAIAHDVSESAQNDVTPEFSTASSSPLPPEAKQYGVVIGGEDVVTGNGVICGVVCDEWSDQYPSETQLAAIAINYDSPQSEPPQAILLCVAASLSLTEWNEASAAKYVAETIEWMRIRSLSAEHRVTPGAMFVGANILPKYEVENIYKSQVPTQSDLMGSGLYYEFQSRSILQDVERFYE